jgi:prepilin-type N-terminal cleavage/methylation domain-containing protein
MYLKSKSGFTAVELLVVLGIMALIAMIFLSTFISFRKNQALISDTDTVIEVLRQARNQTLTSKNSSVYGVHFGTGTITIFTGSTYTSGAAGNQDFLLNSEDTILTVSLTGGGRDVVFDRLTGESSQSGTIVVSSQNISQSRTVTVYKTGLIE